MDKLISHFYILSTIVFTVYSQLVIRWQVINAGHLPEDLNGKLNYIFHLFLNPWIISSIFATLFAGISWMLAMTKFEISYAYPWVALNFVLMLLFGLLLFNESLSASKIAGSVLVIAGIAVMARG